MVKVSSFGSDFYVNDQSFTTKTTVKVAEGVKVQLAHKSGSNALAVQLSGKKFDVQHEFSTQDTLFKFRTGLGSNNTLTVKQHVPAGSWYLVPTPVFELSRTGLLGQHNKLTGSYDCLNRVAKLEEKLYLGPDKQHKAYLRLSTASGPAAGARSRLGAGLLHSAAAHYGEREGWHLSLKSRFADGTKVKTCYSPQRQLLTVAAKHTPKGLAPGAARPTLTMLIDYPLHKQADPQIKLGVKWDL